MIFILIFVQIRYVTWLNLTKSIFISASRLLQYRQFWAQLKIWIMKGKEVRVRLREELLNTIHYMFLDTLNTEIRLLSNSLVRQNILTLDENY